MTTATADTPEVLLEYPQGSAVPTFLQGCDKLARTCAQEKATFPHDLLRLSELESDRDRRAGERRIRQTKFPLVKSRDSLNFLAILALNKTLVLELAHSEYLDRKRTFLLLSNSGTGKTHITLLWCSAPPLASAATTSASSPPPPRLAN